MDFDNAKSILKENYIKAGLELVDEHLYELFFNHGRTNYHISENEIREYADCIQSQSTFKVAPSECGICSPNYREQIVDFIDPDRGRSFFLRDREIVFGDNKLSNLYAEVGQASLRFVNFFRFEEAYLQICLERLRRPILRDGGRTEMRESLYKPLTIKVYNISEPTVEGAIKSSSVLIDSCLFELSYLKRMTLTLVDEWPRRQPKSRPFQFGGSIVGNQLPLPNATFNSDTIRFYQRGMGTNDPVIQFLSFYQVLEYYFVAVTDGQLYGKLSRRINDPKFSATESNLNRLIQDVVEHKQITDEFEMLKAVISKFIDEEELIEFIQAYEAHLNEKLYTRRRILFGEEIQVNLSSGHVTGNIAKTIKTIRNALVHSSDRYERKERYIPSRSSENIIKHEIPLMNFLAEKVIIASAK